MIWWQILRSILMMAVHPLMWMLQTPQTLHSLVVLKRIYGRYFIHQAIVERLHHGVLPMVPMKLLRILHSYLIMQGPISCS